MAQRHFGEVQLCGLLAESVHSRVADLAAKVGIDLLGASPVRVGSLYSRGPYKMCVKKHTVGEKYLAKKLW